MEVWAHRGLHNNEIPENTIPAFDAAYDAGAFGIELDVRICGSGEPIVFHDPVINVSGFNKVIEETSFRDLKEVRLREKYAIPSLDLVLKQYGHEIPLILDVKSSKILDHSLERSIMRLLERYNLVDKVIISSANLLVLLAFKTLSTKCRLAFVMDQYNPLCRFLPVEALHIKEDLLYFGSVEKMKSKNIRAWTVNSKAKALSCASMGLAGIITDLPEKMLVDQEEITQTWSMERE